QHLAFAAVGPDNGKAVVWVRDFESLQSRRLEATEGITTSRLVWSPDSRYIAFEADGKLKKAAVSGGPAQTLTTLPDQFRSAAWNTQGTIIYSSRGSGGILRISES